MWMKHYPSKDFSTTIMIIAVRFIKKRYLKDRKKFEESNMENVPRGYIIHSTQIDIWNVKSKYHTTTDHTKHHMKIHAMKKSLLLFSVCQKIHLQEPHGETC